MKAPTNSKGSGEGDLSQAFELFVEFRLSGLLDIARKGSQGKDWDMKDECFNWLTASVGSRPA